MITTEELDAATLRKAAAIIEARTRKPNGIILKAWLRSLRNLADDIENGKLPVLR
jgi:hypothetical protein